VAQQFTRRCNMNETGSQSDLRAITPCGSGIRTAAWRGGDALEAAAGATYRAREHDPEKWKPVGAPAGT
jgi:hypothetical protein